MQMKTTNYLILWESGEEVGGVNLGTSIKIKFFHQIETLWFESVDN